MENSTKSILDVIYPQSILDSLHNTKILIIGVGGIGCQVLKVVSKFPLSAIHIIDMDTIEASNLNRQFLFKQQHRGHSKSLTAKDALLKLNSKLNIVPHNSNIKDLKISFFKQFDFLVMALDNIEARNYVNKIGVRLNIPIIDAGTLGYKGNANIIIPSLTKCYACEQKSTNQTTFPVCTIRNKPEKPIHCITWAKLLFQVFFGPENEGNDLNDLKEVLKSASDASKSKQATLILQKLFRQEIEGLKNLKSEAEQEKLSDGKAFINYSNKLKPIDQDMLDKEIEDQGLLQSFNDFDKKLDISTNVRIFKLAYEKLAVQRQKDGFIVFQKDDDHIIHFVASAANLRMQCFSIQNQNFYDIKNMAGNIIPAIASTNSIVSGLEIIQMLKIITKNKLFLRSYFVQNLSAKLIPAKIEQPTINCAVCSPQNIPVIFEVNMNTFTCNQLVNLVKQNCAQLQEFSLNIGSDQIYNSEQPNEKILKKTINAIVLKGGEQKIISSVEFLLTDENTSQRVCSIWIIDSNCPETEISIINKDRMSVKKVSQTKINFEEKQTLLDQKLGQKCKLVMPDDDSSNGLICMDDPLAKESDEIDIIEVKKRLNQDVMEIEKQQNSQNGRNGKKHVKIQ